MITIDLARQLREAGLTWTPAAGDRFVVVDKEMDDQVFVISEMTIDVQELPAGRIMKFNGTTEWALDSVDEHEVVWLPREDQLRGALGERFRSLETVTGGFAVALVDVEQRLVDIDAERAYARALLAVIGGSD
ncbi:MAG TPA: pilus assembly protein CpaE [Dermatophilaceae bacterium]|nr:pilus assembly protein CpaE [Dermatophilaceae bacterium]